MTEPESNELRGLLDALCEESITSEQMARLEELVQTYPDAEAYYVQYMNLFADLRRRFAGAAPSPALPLPARLASEPAPLARAPIKQGDKRPWLGRRRLLLRGAAGLLAVAACLLLALWLRPRPETANPPRDQGERMDDSVAVLLQAPGAEWEKTGMPTRVGAPLPAGMLRLKSGLAHLQFYCGATVILEGPAEFQLISRTKAYCASGKLRATVPAQAQGFTIGSPKLEVVDRGTEFGLQVGAGGKTEVHVFQGKVELYDPSGQPKPKPHQELTTGQAVRLEGAGGVQPIKLNPEGFQTAKQLTARFEAHTQKRQQEWLAANAVLRRDPTLLINYTFQPQQLWDRTLLDQSHRRHHPHDGAIVGCSWVAGRWPGKQALEFKQVSDRVRFHLPGEFESIALLAWVRVDALPNVNNSLMMSDAWKSGEMHWQIGDDGKLILGVQSSPKGHGAHYHAHGVITPQRLGQWLHLAVVYDRAQGRVTHYVDGKPVVQLPVLFDIPLRVGDAELGNWNIATHRNSSPIRFLTGCMDEFLLFSRALSDQEVEQIYVQGRPLL
jgi:hypothetical protein